MTRVYEVLLLRMVKTRMYPLHKSVEDAFTQVIHRVVLVEPVMPNEDSAAALIADVGSSISIHARYHTYIISRVVVVADIVGEGCLFVRPVLGPSSTSLVFSF